MFWSKDDIVERLSKIPRTLEDISIDIFEGVPPANDLVYKTDLSKEHCIDATSGCRNPQTNISVEQVSIEQELMYLHGWLSFRRIRHSIRAVPVYAAL